MTPEERAKALIEAKFDEWDYFSDLSAMTRDAIERDIAAANREAVEEEREACAALCDSLEHDCQGLCAKEIRART